MREKILKASAKLFRATVNFRGKHSIGKKIQEFIIRDNIFNNSESFIKMKDGFEILIDLRSDTHSAPFWCGIYDTPLINKFKTLFKENWVVLDIGSNIGYYSIPFAIKLEELEGKILSFEPLTANFEALNISLQRNNCSAISTHKLGLGEKKEKLGLATTEEGRTGNAVITNDVLIKERGFVPKEFIEIDTLDNFYKINRIDNCHFIKVDIEGTEIFFLRGAKETIKKFRPIIFGEFNTYFMTRMDVELKEAWDFFQQIDYHTYRQVRDRIRATSFIKVNKFEDKISDLLFLPKELPTKEIAKWIV